MNDRDKRTFDFIDKELNGWAWIHNLNYAGLLTIHKEKFARNLYGICHPDGRIAIRIRWANGRALMPYAIIDTMAHELAHLKYWTHSEKWFNLHSKILRDMANDGLLTKLTRRMSR
jgi:predicted metal-dependent hydrolase